MTTRALSLFTIVLFLAGCGGGESTDGGTGSDAGHHDGGSTMHDAGGGNDAGGGMDSGTDAGTTADSGSAGMDGGADSGSLLPPIDGGDPFGDAGTLGDPEWADLVVHTDDTMCDAVEACGGDVVGTWDVSGGCVEVPIESAFALCAGAEVRRAEGRARGRVTFEAPLGDAPGIAHRVAQSEVDVQLFVPALCAGFVGGCSGIEMMIHDRGITDAVCVEQGTGDCLCEGRLVTTIDDTDTYTIDDTAHEIVGGSSGKRWAYCIDGDTMDYQDTSTSGMREPGIIELTRR